MGCQNYKKKNKLDDNKDGLSRLFILAYLGRALKEYDTRDLLLPSRASPAKEQTSHRLVNYCMQRMKTLVINLCALNSGVTKL